MTYNKFRIFLAFFIIYSISLFPQLLNTATNYITPQSNIFEKSMDYNIGSLNIEDYKLRKNDILKISFQDEIYREFQVTIDLDGKITIPQIGQITIDNYTISDANKKVREFLQNENKLTNYSMVLLKPTTFTVNISGYVSSPGNYNVTGFTGLFDLINTSEGLLDNASYIINLNRKGKDYKIDLTDILLFNGEISNELYYLQQGDKVFVPLIQDYFTVEGNIKKQTIFKEMESNITYDATNNFISENFKSFKMEVSDSLALKNVMKLVCLNKFTDLNSIEILRNTGESKVVSYNDILDSELFVYSKDKVIFHTENNFIIVTGEITEDNIFFYQPGKSVSYYLGLAQGIDSNSNLKRIYILSSDGTIKKCSYQNIPQKGDTIIIKGNTSFVLKNYLVPLASIGSFIVAFIGVLK